MTKAQWSLITGSVLLVAGLVVLVAATSAWLAAIFFVGTIVGLLQARRYGAKSSPEA